MTRSAVEDTARRVAALGWDPVLASALVIGPVPMEDLPPFRAALVTSTSAIPSLVAAMGPRPEPGSPMAERPVLAIGPGTAEALRSAGFPLVWEAGGDAAALAWTAAMSLDPSEGPLLLATAVGYGDELVADLRERGFEVLRRIAYAVGEAAALPHAARDALAAGRVKAALFLSPRGATTCVRLLRGAGLDGAARDIRALALSPRIAAALSALPWAGLDTAPRPRLDDLLTMLGPARTVPGASERGPR